VQSGFRVSVLLGSFALRENSVQFFNKNDQFFRVLLFCGFLSELAPVVVRHGEPPTAGTKLLWIWISVCTLLNILIEHPEIIVRVIVNSIAKRGSQTSFKKIALLCGRPLFSFQIASRVGAVQGLLFQAGVGSVPKQVDKNDTG
jgi:hypothetical protein